MMDVEPSLGLEWSSHHLKPHSDVHKVRFDTTSDIRGTVTKSDVREVHTLPIHLHAANETVLE